MFIDFENSFVKSESNISKNSTIVGVEIKNEKLNVLAYAILYIKNGLIVQLEIFAKNGSDYPKEEMENYTLTQTWIGSKERIIIN